MKYEQFLSTKLEYKYDNGFEQNYFPDILFDWQKDIVSWCCKKGRSAIFADCGLGKTLMQIAWARNVANETAGKVIIFAPLSVTYQTIREAKEKLSLDIERFDNNYYAQISIANYENLEKLNPDDYSGIVLDESSILKSVDSKTRLKLIKFAQNIEYRLACTATPAPNDISEIANHTEFLGIMKREEMLSKWFYNDGKNWNIKGHATKEFYKWIASWGIFITKPSDLGYDDCSFKIPEINIEAIYFDFEFKSSGTLFDIGLKGIEDRVKIRKDSVFIKAQEIANKINNSNEQWIVWCGIDLESDTLSKLILDSINVKGSDNTDKKEDSFISFIKGEVKVLITKPKIAGFGMNFQHSHNMLFFGMNDSYEYYYQCIRRQYRFGQKEKVNVYIALAGNESVIYENVIRKERDAKMISDEVIKNISIYEQEEIKGSKHELSDYNINSVKIENAELFNGDSCEIMKQIPDNSMDLSIFSPPFKSLFTYSNSKRDLGNCQTDEEFFEHLMYISKELYRIMKPGRNICVHCMNIPTRMISHGYIGLTDFRGELIRHYEKAGFIYYGEVCIWKNPQVQSIRTHTKMLAFQQFNKDSIESCPALPDYILIFKKRGDNAIPIKPLENGLNNDKWIEYASPIWMDINATYTLNSIKADKDEKHMCPLQLEVIERLIQLYSNKNEIVFSPFMGVGSEGYMSTYLERKFKGIELKHEYYNQAVKNIEKAVFDKKINDNSLLSLIA
jgi:DNA modification methylase